MAAASGAAGVLDDLRAEEERLEAILSGLGDAEWTTPSTAPGWSVADVVLHLAISEEAVLATLGVAGEARDFERGGAGIDELMDDMVRAERAAPAVVFERWRRGRRRALDALSAADPDRALSWAAAPLRPGTLATTRLAEHWAHGLDITGGLGITLEDTARLRHVAWLAHRSLPYAFALDGEPAPAVRCVLDGPEGERWEFGPADAGTTVEGPAGEFCRVAARRLTPEQTRLVASGPHGDEVLTRFRTYAA